MEYMLRKDPITGLFENVPVPEESIIEEPKEVVAEQAEVVVISKKIGRPPKRAQT